MSDPRVHGPERCPKAPAGCEACSGFHHWLEDGYDPAALEDADEYLDGERMKALFAHDKENGTNHAEAFYGCKHCDAWAEAEYVWELEEALGEAE